MDNLLIPNLNRIKPRIILRITAIVAGAYSASSKRKIPANKLPIKIAPIDNPINAVIKMPILDPLSSNVGKMNASPIAIAMRDKRNTTESPNAMSI